MEKYEILKKIDEREELIDFLQKFFSFEEMLIKEGEEINNLSMEDIVHSDLPDGEENFAESLSKLHFIKSHLYLMRIDEKNKEKIDTILDYMISIFEEHLILCK